MESQNDTILLGQEHPADSKNPGTTFIFIIIIALIIIGIVFLLINIAGGGSNAGNVQFPPSQSCDSKTSGLTDISRTTSCPGTTQKYMGDLNMLVGPAPVPYQTVCKEFCPGVGNYNTTNDTCSSIISGTTAQDQFDTCIAKLKPVDCVGPANPVAISDGLLYYGQKRSLTAC